MYFKGDIVICDPSYIFTEKQWDDFIDDENVFYDKPYNLTKVLSVYLDEYKSYKKIIVNENDQIYKDYYKFDSGVLGVFLLDELKEICPNADMIGESIIIKGFEGSIEYHDDNYLLVGIGNIPFILK